LTSKKALISSARSVFSAQRFASAAKGRLNRTTFEVSPRGRPIASCLGDRGHQLGRRRLQLADHGIVGGGLVAAGRPQAKGPSIATINHRAIHFGNNL
jgi:hypothetical protein